MAPSTFQFTPMTHPLQLADGALLVSLRELIQAIDRRAPRAERIGEVGITLVAQTLRRQATARIAELTPAGQAANAYDEDLAGSVMTDDGAPPPRRRSARTALEAPTKRRRRHPDERSHRRRIAFDRLDREDRLDRIDAQSRVMIASALIIRGAVAVPSPGEGAHLRHTDGLRLRELTDHLYRLLTAEKPS